MHSVHFILKFANTKMSITIYKLAFESAILSVYSYRILETPILGCSAHDCPQTYKITYPMLCAETENKPNSYDA